MTTEAEIRNLFRRLQEAERKGWVLDRQTAKQMREWLQDLPERLQESDAEAK